MNVTFYRGLSLASLALAVAGVSILTTGRAHSQLSVAKNYVALQPTAPGSAQSGHLNVSGVVAGSQGAFSSSTPTGSTLTATATAGTATALAATGPANGFAGVFQGRVLMDGAVAISPTMPASLTAASLYVGDPNGIGFEGIAAISAFNGRPFFSFIAGGSTRGYLEYNVGVDALRIVAGNQAVASFRNTGDIGVGTDAPSARLHVNNGAILSTPNLGAGNAGIDVSFHENQAIPTTNKIGVNVGVGGAASIAPFHIAITGRASGGTSGNTGVFAIAENAAVENNFAVYGIAPTGAANYAGYFVGNLFATSSSSGVKAFKIDHPLDPENMYLEHSSVESDQRMNLYRGRVATDSKGYASISVPSWFDALNDNLEYQLTVLDYTDSSEFVQAKVVSPLKNGSFRIRTSAPHVQVSWMLTGERIDPVARANPLRVESQKPEVERGKLLFPREYGYGMDRSVAPQLVPAPVSTRKP